MRLSTALLLLQLASAPAAITASGSIQGTVVRAGSQAPIDEVHVVLVSASSNEIDASRLPVSISAVTDAVGRFVLKNLAPGDYRMTLSANGYVRQEYGQRAFPGTGTSITIADGQTIKDFIAEMTPTGAISGTIRDRDKNPLPGVQVQLMRDSYDANGERKLRPYSAVARTDDRGVFRIFFVTPGRYFLQAGRSTNQTPQNEVQETFGYVYYPGVMDPKLAIPIEIAAGATNTGADFTMETAKGVHVSGHVIDITTGKPPENAMIFLTYRDPGTATERDLASTVSGNLTYHQDGSFEVRNVLPGSYAALVMVEIAGQPKPVSGPRQLQGMDYVPFEVGGTNVDNVVLTVKPGTSIRGRIRLEGQGEWTNSAQKPAAVYSVALSPVTKEMVSVSFPLPQRIGADGRFRIDNVMPGEFRVDLSGFRSNYYIKEARFGPTDILTRPFQFDGNQPGEIEIVLSSSVASVEGQVTSNGLAPAAGAQVVLVPDRSRYRTSLYRAVTTNQSGRFNIPDIPPGDYRLYAWESIELYRWFDPELLKSAEERYSIPVHLTESATQTVDARLIPKLSQ